MNYTTNYNLNKPEGTDLYNHLTVDNPNMDAIDNAMHANKLQAIGNATELVSGTVHAITRSDSDQNIFRFKATGDFKAGDTITVDGVSVNAYTTDGQQLLDDAYVLSAEVLCILDGTSLWVLVNKTPDGTEIKYDSVSTVNQKIDAVAADLVSLVHKYTNLNITNDRGGTELNKGTLYATGNVGILNFAFVCQNASQEIVTVSLPTGWSAVRNGIVLRDNNNGALINAYVAPGTNSAVVITFAHTGTMVVGHLYFVSVMVVKD